MTRFNTPEEVRAWAKQAAKHDYERHIEHGIDMNPFCTDGARSEWQRGFDGSPIYSWEGNMDFATIFQRGKAMGEIVAAEKAKKN